MKQALMLTLAAGGLLLATSGDAQAQSWNRGRSNGFGISLNLGSPYGYNSQRSYRNTGYGINPVYRNSGYGFNSGYSSRFAPRQDYGYSSGRYTNRSNYYGGSQRHIPQQSYGYGGGRRGCGY